MNKIVQISEFDLEYEKLLEIFDKYLVEHVYMFKNNRLYIIHFGDFVKYRTCLERALIEIPYHIYSVEDVNADNVVECNIDGKVIREESIKKINSQIKEAIRSKRDLDSSDIIKRYFADLNYNKISVLASSKIKLDIIKFVGNGKIIDEYENADFIISDNEIKSTILRLRGYNAEFIFDFYDKMMIFKKLFEWHDTYGIPLFYFSVPKDKNFSEFTKNEIERMKKKLSFEEMAEDAENYYKDFKELIKEDVTLDYIKGLRNNPKLVEVDNQFFYLDYASELVNIRDGVRITLDQSENCVGRIFIWGKCTIFGYAVEDKDTIPSMIQNKLNQIGLNDVHVINRGIKGLSFRDMFKSIINSKPNATDSYIIVSDDLCENDIFFLKKIFLNAFDTIEIKKNSNQEIVYDKPFHFNWLGNKLFSDYIYDNSIPFFLKHYCNRIIGQLNWQNEWQKRSQVKIFEEYRSIIDSVILKNESKNNGIIIVNANPMTKGHEYLIDYSRKLVDNLFVLVGQVENGMFTFEERIKMVKNVCAKYENVIVMGAGYYFTKKTFPAYFNRNVDDLDKIKIDNPLFFDELTKIFSIKTRFLGEEPLDPITNELNKFLKLECKRRGITCCIIPRLCIGDEIISASKVRNAILNKNYELMDLFLPKENIGEIINICKKNNI